MFSESNKLLVFHCVSKIFVLRKVLKSKLWNLLFNLNSKLLLFFFYFLLKKINIFEKGKDLTQRNSIQKRKQPNNFSDNLFFHLPLVLLMTWQSCCKVHLLALMIKTYSCKIHLLEIFKQVTYCFFVEFSMFIIILKIILKIKFSNI